MVGQTARRAAMWAVAVVLLGAGALASGVGALSIAKYGSYAPMLGGGLSAESAAEVSGASGFACGDTVSVFHTVDVAAREAAFELRLSAASNGAKGAAFSECLRAVAESANGGSVELKQSLVGSAAVFESGAEVVCSVRIDGVRKPGKLVVRIDVRLACEAGASPRGALSATVGTQTAVLTEVERVRGAAEPYVTLEKTVTTGDGLCGVHDSKLLTDSYVAADMREIKFCYTVMNRGTRPACGLSLVQNSGLEDGASVNVALHALSDACSAGEYNALPASTTTGRAPSAWSGVTTEHTLRYPCGVTKVEPVARVVAAGSTLAAAAVSIDAKDSCGGAASPARAAAASGASSRLSLDDSSLRQTELSTCPCIIMSKMFYVLEETAGPGADGISTCILRVAFDGWQCLDLLDIESLPSAGAYEICYFTEAVRYVPWGTSLFNKTVGDSVGCKTRTVDIVEPVVLTRLI